MPVSCARIGVPGDSFSPGEGRIALVVAGTQSAALIGRSVVHSAIGALGLAGLLVGMGDAWRLYRFAALLLVLTAPPCFLVQTVVRRHDLILGLLMMFCADLVARLWQRVSPSSGKGQALWKPLPGAGTAR